MRMGLLQGSSRATLTIESRIGGKGNEMGSVDQGCVYTDASARAGRNPCPWGSVPYMVNNSSTMLDDFIPRGVGQARRTGVSQCREVLGCDGGGGLRRSKSCDQFTSHKETPPGITLSLLLV